jgi:tetratricopeptide (TPR) repeat protein
MESVVRATSNVENETPVDTAILLYCGRALAALGMQDAAIVVFTLANRRRKDRPEGVMLQIRYDRAVLYEQVGRAAQARREFERLFAENPEFADLHGRARSSTVRPPHFSGGPFSNRPPAPRPPVRCRRARGQ